MTNPASNLSAVTQIRPRITHWQPPVDLEAAERAAASFLTALGVDISGEATVDTPRRADGNAARSRSVSSGVTGAPPS